MDASQVIFLALTLIVTAKSQDSCPAIQHGQLTGDIILGFSFPFYDAAGNGKSCSDVISKPSNIQLLEAANYVIKQNQNVIPGIQIGLESWDSCYSSAVAIENSITFLNNRQIGYGAGAGRSCGSEIKPGIVGHFGEDRGPAVASLMTDTHISLTAYGTSLIELNAANEQYSYFTRVVPSDRSESTAIADLLVSQGWSYISVLYENSPEEKAAAEEFLLIAKTRNVCVAYSALLSSSSDYASALAAISGIENLGVVITFLGEQQGMDFFTFISSSPTGLQYQYIVSHHNSLSSSWSQSISTSELKIIRVSPTIADSDTSDGFDDYFKSLNVSNYDQDADIWFTAFWEEAYGCSVDGLSGPLCDSTDVVEHMSNFERHPYVNAVLDSLSAHIEALKNLHNSKCGGNAGLCLGILETTPEEYHAMLKNVAIPGAASQSRVSFGANGGPLSTSLDVTTITFPGPVATQNGIWLDGALTLSGQSIASFSSMCGTPCMDPTCLSAAGTTNETKVYIDGDIILAGLFAINDWDADSNQCGNLTEEGVLRLQAMIYAVNKINSDPILLPQIRLGMDGINTCRNPAQAAHQTLQLLSGGDFDQSGSGTRVSDSGSIEHIYAIIGPETNEETIEVVKVASTYGVPVMGYAADSYRLSSTFSYPGFARSVPTDTDYFTPMAMMMSELNFKYIQVLYSSTSSSSTVLSVLTAYAKANDVCISQSIGIPSSDMQADWDSVFSDLTKKPYAKALFLFANSNDIIRVLQQIQTRSLAGKYFIVAGNTWSLDSEDAARYPNAANGAVFGIRPPREYDDFKTYVSSLRPDTNPQNPWFSEFWSNKFHCSIPGVDSAYAIPCSSQANSLRTDEAGSEIVADVIDGVYGIATALQILHEEKCGGIGGICPDMANAPGSDLFSLITQISFNSLNDQRVVSYNFQGDFVTAYDIYNYQNNPVKVGTYDNYRLTLDRNQPIRFYDENNQVRTEGIYSVCNVTQCIECESLYKDDVAEISGGDVWLAAFFELNEPAVNQFDCTSNLIGYNIQLLEAFLFAVDEVNDDPTILPDLKIGALAFDSCGTKKKVSKVMTNLLSGTIDYRKGYNPNRIAMNGVIGGGSSDTTQAVANVLVTKELSVISYGGTAVQFSKATKYPNVLRTVPSDERQAAAIVSILNRFSWKYIVVVYSDTVYGNDLYTTLSKLIDASNICFALSLKVNSKTNFDSVISTILSIPENKVVLLLTSDLDARSVLQAAEQRNVIDIQWVGTDSWGSRDYVISGAEVTSLGAVIIELRDSEARGFGDYFTGMSIYTNTRNPWWRQYWGEKFMCNIYGATSDYDKSCSTIADNLSNDFIQAPEVTYVINAVKAYAVGLQEAMAEYCPNVTNHFCAEVANNPTGLFQHIRNSMFEGADGNNFRFRNYRDGPAQYDIINIQRAIDSVQYIKIGSWNDGYLQLPTSSAKFYEGNRQVSQKESQCTGRCLECKTGQIGPTAITAYVAGQIQIPTFIAIHVNGDNLNECGNIRETGIINLEALLYAVDLINKDSTILPGVDLGTTIFDTCFSSARAFQEMSAFVTRTGDAMSDKGWFWTGGVIGAEDSSVAAATAIISEQYQLNQVSFSSSSKQLGAFFSQTAPPTGDFLRIIFDILETYGWNWVNVIMDVNNRDKRAMGEAFVEASASHGICVGQKVDYDGKYTPELQMVFQGNRANVGILFMSFKEANKMASFLFISSHTTFIIPNTYAPPADVKIFGNLYGSIIISPPAISTDFSTYISQLSSNSRNPWLSEFIRSKYYCGGRNQPECLDSYTLTLEDAVASASVMPIMDAVFAIANGLENVRAKYCGGGKEGLCPEFLEAAPEEVIQSISGVSFTGVGDRTVTLGNQSPITYTLWNVGIDEVQYQNVGKWLDGTLEINSKIRLLSTELLSGPVTSFIEKCDIITTGSPPIVSPSIGAQGSNGSFENYVNDVWFIVIVIASLLGVVLSVICLIAMMYQHHSPQAQVYCLFLNFVILFGLIMIFCQNIIFGLEVSNVICNLRLILPCVAFTICFLALFLMTLRFYRILAREKRISGPRTQYINNSSQAVMFFILFPVICIFIFQLAYYGKGGVANFVDAVGIIRCSFDQSYFPVSFLFVYLLMILTVVISILALRRSKTIFSRELIGHLICTISCGVIAILWIIIGQIESSYIPFTSILFTIQGYILLLCLIPIRIFNVCRSHDAFEDAASVVSGEFRDRGSVGENTYDMATPPQSPNPDGETNTYENPAYCSGSEKLDMAEL